MRGAFLALAVAVGLLTAWSQAAWSDPVDGSGRKYRGDRSSFTERNSERRRTYRERRRASTSYRNGPRYSRRHREDVRYSRRWYDDGPRYTRRRYDDGPRYSRRRYDDGVRYSRAYGPPVVYYSQPAGGRTMRVLINPDAEVPGAYGWRDQYQPIGPLVTPRAIEMFFQRSQDRSQ